MSGEGEGPWFLPAPFPQAEIIFLLFLNINETLLSLLLPPPPKEGVKETRSMVLPRGAGDRGFGFYGGTAPGEEGDLEASWGSASRVPHLSDPPPSWVGAAWQLPWRLAEALSLSLLDRGGQGRGESAKCKQGCFCVCLQTAQVKSRDF